MIWLIDCAFINVIIVCYVLNATNISVLKTFPAVNLLSLMVEWRKSRAVLISLSFDMRAVFTDTKQTLWWSFHTVIDLLHSISCLLLLLPVVCVYSLKTSLSFINAALRAVYCLCYRLWWTLKEEVLMSLKQLKNVTWISTLANQHTGAPSFMEN